ncbi:MAG: transglutaminase family protein [Verrucomicrobiota bacterium]
MKYQVKHVTTYRYSERIDISYHHARLKPLRLPGQQRKNYRFHVSPQPASRNEHRDFFGNQVNFFVIDKAHEKLTITSQCQVETSPRFAGLNFAQSQPWEKVAETVRRVETPLSERQYALPSPLIQPGPELLAYAKPSFPKGRPLLEGAADLMARIHKDFQFVSGFTTIATPIEEALQVRKGVCQDFAQIALGCLRSLGLPAKYVSGYLETLPPPGQAKLQGADASHAWYAVWDPQLGWVEFDPTNNLIPKEQHVVIGYGRDFSDISPVKGVLLGPESHYLDVAVDLIPISADRE